MSEFTPTMPPPEDEGAVLPEYRTVSVPAILGLLLGVSSMVTLVSPIMLIVPLAGILLNIRALVGLADRRSNQTGRGLAYLGLFLAVLFAVAGPVDSWGNRWFLERSARPVIDAWFESLRQRQPERALQLTLTAILRRPLDDKLDRYYRTHLEAHRQLETYVADPLVKTLLLLGERAQVRLYDSEPPVVEDRREKLSQTYAVTYDDEGKKTTFFVTLWLERALDKSGQLRWRITQAAGGIRPASWFD